MKRNGLRAVALAVALAAAAPATALARAELVGWSGAVCCLDFGLRLSLRLEGAELRGALTLPGPSVSLDGSHELVARGTGPTILSVALKTSDIAGFGVPVVRAIVELSRARDARTSGAGCGM